MFTSTSRHQFFASTLASAQGRYELEITWLARELPDGGHVLDGETARALANYITSRCSARVLDKEFDFRPTPLALAAHFWQYANIYQPALSARVSTDNGRTWSGYFPSGSMLDILRLHLAER